MRQAIKYITFIFLISLCHQVLANPDQKTEMAEKHYFQFVVPKHMTRRQSGQIVNIYVRYAYSTGSSLEKLPDYRLLRRDVLKYMKPSDQLPVDTYWEVIAANMGRSLIKHYPLSGVSVQLVVLGDDEVGGYEPGDHGAIYTAGNIEPLNH